jgi:hypothetical protein
VWVKPAKRPAKNCTSKDVGSLVPCERNELRVVGACGGSVWWERVVGARGGSVWERVVEARQLSSRSLLAHLQHSPAWVGLASRKCTLFRVPHSSRRRNGSGDFGFEIGGAIQTGARVIKNYRAAWYEVICTAISGAEPRSTGLRPR